jgi:hypothetical protein
MRTSWEPYFPHILLFAYSLAERGRARDHDEVSETRSEPVQCHLDDIGVQHGSELSSLSRDMLRSWERFLAPLRDQTFDLLQIGVGTGASLRTWREWFPEARLVGLDPRRLVLEPPIGGCTIVQGNQTDLDALQPLLRDYRFRLIVDDGSHHPDDQVQTFQLLFPWLEPDSVYICAGFDESTILAENQDRQERQQQGSQKMKGLTTGAGGPERATRPGETLARSPKRPSRPPNLQTGPAWFAELGRSLAASDLPGRRTQEQPTRTFIRRKATGVNLLPGCVVVTS